jgi:hypothetical protein
MEDEPAASNALGVREAQDVEPAIKQRRPRRQASEVRGRAVAGRSAGRGRLRLAEMHQDGVRKVSHELRPAARRRGVFDDSILFTQPFDQFDGAQLFQRTRSAVT